MNAMQYVNMKDERNTTALHYAVQFNHIDIVEYLIEKGASTFFNFHIFCVRVVPIPVHLCSVCRCSIVFVLNYSKFSYLCMLTVYLLEHWSKYLVYYKSLLVHYDKNMLIFTWNHVLRAH